MQISLVEENTLRKIKGILIVIISFILLLSGCNKGEKNQTLINFFGEEKYGELSLVCSDKGKLQVANDLVELANTVLTNTQIEYTADEIGALIQYSHNNPNITNADIDIKLITTEQIEDTGYMWVQYSAYYYEDENLVSGSKDVISRWTITRENGVWTVTLVEEP